MASPNTHQMIRYRRKIQNKARQSHSPDIAEKIAKKNLTAFCTI